MRSLFYSFILSDKASANAEKINRSLKKVDGTTQQVSRSAKRMSGVYDKAAVSTDRLASTLRNYAGAAALMATASRAIHSAAAAQKALNHTLSNAADEVIAKKLTPEVKKQIDVLRSMGYGIEEIDRALFKMTSQAGLTQETLDSIAGATLLAQGGYTDLELAISATNKQLEAFSDLGGDSRKAARQIFEAQRIGDTSVEALAQFSSVSAGAAGSMGLLSAEQLAILSIFSKPLKNTASVSEALKALLADIKMGGQGEASKTRAMLGLPTNEVEFAQRGGIVPFLERVAYLRGTARGKLALAKAFTSMEATRLLDFATPDRISQLRAGIQAIGAGSNLDSAAATRAQSLEMALNKLAAVSDRMLQQLGDVIGPSLTRLADALVKVTGDGGVGSRGRVWTPSFLGGEGGPVDRFLETGTYLADLASAPINALAMPLVDYLNQGITPRPVHEFVTQKPQVMGEIMLNLRVSTEDGLKTRTEYVTRGDLDVGVQEQ